MNEQANALVKAVSKYLADLETTQSKLIALAERETQAIPTGNATRLEELSQAKAKVLAHMQEFLNRRVKLLEQGRSLGFLSESLRDLMKQIPDVSQDVFQRLRVVERNSRRIHRLGMSQWVACQKASLHYQQVATLIATNGRFSSVDQTNQHLAGKGTVIDVSA